MSVMIELPRNFGAPARAERRQKGSGSDPEIEVGETMDLIREWESLLGSARSLTGRTVGRADGWRVTEAIDAVIGALEQHIDEIARLAEQEDNF